MLVYLPPSYGKEPQRRYPTIYLLHGFGGDHTFFTSAGFLNVFLNALAGLDLNADLGQIVTELMASGQMGETIVVMPNATNAYGGSMYERSEVIGDYRTYVAKDLVAYIDGRYRTVADPNHRGIAGMSMGGDGALSLAIEYPEVFGAVAALGPGPVDRQMEPNEIDDFVTAFPVACGLPSMGSTLEDVWNMTLGNAMTTSVFYANAAAITPNPKKPPFFVDLPVKYPEKTAVPALWGAWVDRDLVHQVRQSGANFAKMPVLVVEGRGPTMLMAQVPGNDRLLAALYAKGVSYTYRAVPGDHLSGMRYQLSAALEFLYGHIAPRIEAK